MGNKVHLYGTYLQYGGVFVIIAACLTLYVEFVRLVHISKLPDIHQKIGDDPEKNEELL